MQPMTDGLTIAQAAERFGLTTDTLRYYEKDGLMLRPVGRAPSGHRRYSPDDLRWIELITRLRATGMAIRDVRRYTELVREHRRKVLAQLAEVQEHLGAIDHKIGIYTEVLEGRSEGAA
jgi:DNA-binding transcriptional MerR regulator